MAAPSSKQSQGCLINWDLTQSPAEHRVPDPPPSDVYPRTKVVTPGDKVPYLFSDAEMSRRVSGLRSYMSKHQIEAAILTSIHNLIYFGGFFIYPMGRKYGVVITQDKCKLLVSVVDGGRPWRMSPAEVIYYTDWQQDNFFHVIQQELGDLHGKVGLELDYVSVTDAAKFDQILPNARKMDIGYGTMKLKQIKSEEEVKVLRNGTRIADIGGTAAVEAIKKGVSEYEAAQAAVQGMEREIAQAYPRVEIRDSWCWVASGINADCGHPPNTSRQPQPGDNISINTFCLIGGYYAALERTAFFEHATDDQIRIWKQGCAVHNRGLEMVKPGVRCCDIAKVITDMYKKYDLTKYRTAGYGHPSGVFGLYHGRERGDVEIRETCAVELHPGMLVAMVPWFSIPQGTPGAGTYREQDLFLVTENGAEKLTNFPTGPEHLIIKK